MARRTTARSKTRSRITTRPSRHPALARSTTRTTTVREGGAAKYVLPALVVAVLAYALWPEKEAQAGERKPIDGGRPVGPTPPGPEPQNRPVFQIGQRVVTTAPSNLRVRTGPRVNGAVTPEGQGLPIGTVITVTSVGHPATPGAPQGWTGIKDHLGRDGFVSTEWIRATGAATAGLIAAAPYQPTMTRAIAAPYAPYGWR